MVAAFGGGAEVMASEPQFNLVKPSTTGVPGEEVRVMTFDADGNLWIAGRWPFWGECGLAMLSADQLAHEPLPGGGFDTGAWRVWSNVHHPIPSPYIFDLEITAEGIVWIASEGGLTRFDRDAKTPQTMWHTYNAANSPLIMNSVGSIDMDSQGNIWLTNVSVQSANGAVFRFDPTTNQWTQYTVGQEIPGWEPPWLDVASVMVGSDDRVYVTHSVLQGFVEFDGTTWTYHGGGSQFGGMLEDVEGNIWFLTGASGAGVWKWNGASYQSWLGLGGTSTVTGLGMDLEGTVYVSTWYGPVFKMVNGTTPQFFIDADNIPRSLIQRPNGDFWINNYGGNGTLGTVRHYDVNGNLLERFNTYNSGLPDYFIDNIEKDNTGNMWFASGEGGLSRMLGSSGAQDAPTHWRNWGNHNDQSEPYPFAGNEPMYSMYHHSDGTVYMGGNGVAQWDPQTGTFLNFWNWQNSSLGVDSFVDIERDGNGDLWIASDYTGIYRLNTQTNNWEQHLFGAAFSTSNYVNDMERDLDGNLWVVTDIALHFFDGTNWFAITVFHGSPVEQPTCIEVHPDGSVWIGASNGLIRYHNAEWTIYDSSNSPMPTDHVQGMDIRDDGVIGFSVIEFGPVTPFPNGVVLFDPAGERGADNWQVFSYGSHPLPHYQLGDVEFDADGDIWVSTISEGVVEIVLGSDAVAGDATGDGLVNVDDLVSVILAWGLCPDAPAACSADLNGSGAVDVDDLVLVILNWT
jgi:ligand-binding sensor domain-containing protein